MQPTPRLLLAGALLLALHGPASAAVFRHITAESAAGASIDRDGLLTESNVSYPAIYAPSPREVWCRVPWLNSSQAFKGSRSIGMELKPPPAARPPSPSISAAGPFHSTRGARLA